MAIYDFVIVGAGAAGCIVASRLASRFPEAQLLLVEAGADCRGLFNFVPLLSGFAPFRKGVNWLHAASHAGRDTLLYQGRMVGGSSEINGMVVSRGFADDYAPWQEAAGEQWSFPACIDAFKRLERFQEEASPLHGVDGPMSVRRVEPYGPLPEAFLAAAGEAGFPVVDDLNTLGGPRFGLTDLNIHDGRRHSARSAWLPRLPANLTLLANTRAHRIELAGNRARALVLRTNDHEELVDIGSEVVLTCGAVATAALLLRSGIGPANDLSKSDIKPVIDHAQVGANLQNHPSYLLRVPTRGGSLADLLSPWNGMAAGLKWLSGRTGPLAQGLFQAAGYFPVGSDRVEAQVVMSPALFPPKPPGKRPSLPRHHGASFAIQQGSPFSRGRIRMRPGGGLTIETGALSDARDLSFMEAAVLRMQEILSRPAFHCHVSDASVFAKISGEGIRQSIGTAYHMAGTARMGLDAGAVTDPQLRVRGVDGLRIADASIMPVIPNAALHFPTMMIAQRAADFIIAENRGRA